jgi:hypothetical protein
MECKIVRKTQSLPRKPMHKTKGEGKYYAKRQHTMISLRVGRHCLGRCSLKKEIRDLCALELQRSFPGGSRA